MTDLSELSRIVKLRAVQHDPYAIEASAAECASLARRFDLIAVAHLSAEVTLLPDGRDILAQGVLKARWTQLCAVSGEQLEQECHEPFSVLFVPQNATHAPDEEIELTEDELDQIEYSGDAFDLGEAVAQSFGLAIDPYACGPDAEKARAQTGIRAEGSEDGPLAELLAGLKR